MASHYQGNNRELAALDAFIALTRAADAMQTAAFGRTPVPEEISMTQFEVLEALLHREPLTQAEIGKKILKTKGNISYTLDKLVKRGYVQRRVCDEDRRERLIELTSAGRKLIGDYFPHLARSFALASLELDEFELELLAGLAKRLGHGADNQTTQPKTVSQGTTPRTSKLSENQKLR
ncbi:MAG: MarR family transcriptional regulator [Spirochaetaceae bacterium]|nr:MarR family transcriptional regulator [Spirochaetaceae bacterium]MCF7947254.1 MarR family transcriptional regulator [Spirochaetia bacterium]MCF7950293.1 MarR family transcriptional regulator [Spirochaetaceae bacterium]